MYRWPLMLAAPTRPDPTIALAIRCSRVFSTAIARRAHALHPLLLLLLLYRWSPVRRFDTACGARANSKRRRRICSLLSESCGFVLRCLGHT